MRNLLKATTLESKFPLLAVEGGCIISKDADITVVYRVELPELFTVTSAEYEAIHAAWCKALKVLPEYSVVHKQDWFIREHYRPATGEGDMSFLSRSYERHFNERPFLTHACFLYLTKTTRERMHMRSDFSTLCRGNIIPKEVNRESATKFLEAAEQFERILNDSGFLTLVRLTGDEITGTADCPGLLERYFSLSLSETTSLQDIELGAEVLRVGNKRVCLHTLSDTEDLPGRVVRIPVTSVFPPTVRTACSRSRPPWGFCFPATTFTTSTCSWKTATKTCVCSRNVRVTCSPFPATPAETR